MRYHQPPSYWQPPPSRQLFEALYTLRNTAIKMAACSNKQKKDLLTDDEINVLECFQKFSDEDTWQLFAE